MKKYKVSNNEKGVTKYVVTVPITFNFETLSDCKADKLYKLARAYLDMCLSAGKYSIGAMEITGKVESNKKFNRNKPDIVWEEYIATLER